MDTGVGVTFATHTRRANRSETVQETKDCNNDTDVFFKHNVLLCFWVISWLGRFAQDWFLATRPVHVVGLERPGSFGSFYC